MSEKKLFWKRRSGKEMFYYWDMIYDKEKGVET